MFSGLQTETIPPINALEYIISWKRHLTFFLRRCFQQTNLFCQFLYFATWIDEIKQRLSDYHHIRQHWKRHFDKKGENLLLAYELKFPLGVRTLTFICLPSAEKRRFLDKICVSTSGSFHFYRPIANMATISPKRGFSVATVAKGWSLVQMIMQVRYYLVVFSLWKQ